MWLTGEGRAGAIMMVLAAVVAGCAAIPRCPARGGPPWTELTSAHFILRTDLDITDAREAITELEQTRAAMLAAVWDGDGGPPDRLRVIALASNRELAAFTGTSTIAGLWTHRSPFPPTMLTGGFFQGGRHGILHHELAHHLSRWFLPRQPTWFAEGVATYLETIRYDSERQRAVVGEPSPQRVRAARVRGLYPTSRLLTEMNYDVEDIDYYETTCWLLFHYLMNHRLTDFETLQRRMGAFEAPQQAWAATLGNLDASELAVTLRNYLAMGEYTVSLVPVPPWNGPVWARPMSDAEVHGTRAVMYALARPGRAPEDVRHARAEIAEALAATPAGDLDALTVQYYYDEASAGSEQRRALAQRASASYPQAAMSWLMVADATDLRDSKQTALTRALALAPFDSEVLARLAILKASRGRWDEAVVFSRKAIRLGVTSLAVLVVHVQALVNTGQCPEAAFFAPGLRQAAASQQTVHKLLARWPDLEQQCLRVAAARRQQADLPTGNGADAAGTAGPSSRR